MLADSFTKALLARLFKRHQGEWELIKWQSLDSKSLIQLTKQGRKSRF